MSCRLVVRREARADIMEAASWYSQQKAQLGVDFSVATDAAIDSLAENALLYRVRARHHGKEVRWLFTRRFPYRVMYYHDGKTVRIFAVLHASRSDAHWQERA